MPPRQAYMKRTPTKPGLPRNGGLRQVSPRRAREIEVPAVKSAATRRSLQTSGRGESFPPAVAALIDARDPWCIHCGSPDDLQRHHRRIRGIGGDGRDHTHCACAGVRLCARCHLGWAHGEGRSEAEAEGIIIPRSELYPWRRPLLVHTQDGGFTAWPTCDGRYVTEMPEGALAA